MKELSYKVSCTGMSMRVTHPDGKADFLAVPEQFVIPAGREYPVMEPAPGTEPGVCDGVTRPGFVKRSKDGKTYTFHGIPARAVRDACIEWYKADE